MYKKKYVLKKEGRGVGTQAVNYVERRFEKMIACGSYVAFGMIVWVCVCMCVCVCVCVYVCVFGV